MGPKGGPAPNVAGGGMDPKGGPAPDVAGGSMGSKGGPAADVAFVSGCRELTGTCVVCVVAPGKTLCCDELAGNCICCTAGVVVRGIGNGTPAYPGGGILKFGGHIGC